MAARHWVPDPRRNIGVVCGEAFDAFDIEVAYLPALRAWMEAHRYGLPLTPLARTGRGGIHVLVKPFADRGRDLYLEGVHIGELKSNGGFIVVAPSITDAPYRWLRAPDETPLAQAPDWLAALAVRARVVARRPRSTRGHASSQALDALVGAISRAGPGRRNNVLYWAMRRAQEEGIPAYDAANALARSGLAAGLEEREVRATIWSAIEGDRR